MADYNKQTRKSSIKQFFTILGASVGQLVTVVLGRQEEARHKAGDTERLEDIPGENLAQVTLMHMQEAANTLMSAKSSDQEIQVKLLGCMSWMAALLYRTGIPLVESLEEGRVHIEGEGQFLLDITRGVKLMRCAEKDENLVEATAGFTHHTAAMLRMLGNVNSDFGKILDVHGTTDDKCNQQKLMWAALIGSVSILNSMSGRDADLLGMAHDVLQQHLAAVRGEQKQSGITATAETGQRFDA